MLREHNDPFGPLAVSDPKEFSWAVDVGDAQVQTFADAKSGTVEET